MTVGQPVVMFPPCTVMSPIRAASLFSIKTENDPKAIVSGGPTQVHMSPTRAAGIKPIDTVTLPMMIGPPTCGTGGVPGVAIGQA
jgi:hypothetical protein